MELYINPANLAPGVKYGPTPGGHYRTLTLLDDFFKSTKMAEKRIHNPDKSSSADVGFQGHMTKMATIPIYGKNPNYFV